jgi:3-oxoacyl-[acyl-carrier protein] reductase
MQLLKNKVAIVTGAARGIGEGIVRKFAEHGADIAFTFVSDSSAQRAKALEEELSHLGIRIKAYQSNAADFSESENFVSEVVREFGTVDICVNNAGISKDNLLLRISPEQWREVIQTNLDSVYNLTRQVIKPMMKAKSGSIINISSVVGIRGNGGQSSYAASKAGIIGFTKSIAVELGSRNVRSNAIAPGYIETDMTQYLKKGQGAAEFLKKIPMGRFGTISEIADTALFLASDMSTYVTGQVIATCGGLSI